MWAALKAQIDNTDRNDARGIAQMVRVGHYRPVHVKTQRSQKLRMLLTHRKLLQSKAIAVFCQSQTLRGRLEPLRTESTEQQLCTEADCPVVDGVLYFSFPNRP